MKGNQSRLVARICVEMVQHKVPCRWVIDVTLPVCECYTWLTRTRIIVYKVSCPLPLPLQSSQTWAAVAAHWLEFEVSRCRTSQFSKCFPPTKFVCGMTFPTVFNTGTMNGFKRAINCWLLRWVVFFQFSVGQVQWWIGLQTQFIKNFVYPTSVAPLVLITLIITWLYDGVDLQPNTFRPHTDENDNRLRAG